MKDTRSIMGMPVTVEVVGEGVNKSLLESVFQYFSSIDARFSTYKEDSEISRINRGEILPNDYSSDMKTIFHLAEETKDQTEGYFDIGTIPECDPSGIVKGWAIFQASQQLLKRGFRNFYVEAGGDIQVSGKNDEREKWRIGIRNPFNTKQYVKVLQVTDVGVATSGTYERGEHIYNPKSDHVLSKEIVSLTVIGPNIYEADRFATAAFVMGRAGIQFIEDLDGFEGYMIDVNGVATFTNGLDTYLGAV